VEVKPAFTALQVVPLFVEKKTPPPRVPAKRFVPLVRRAETFLFVSPVLAAIQVVPLFVERKTPPPFAPAKMVVPLTAKEDTMPPSGPLV
jgi:hypothetical protein